ncbi:helix-turn-helix domain-containing protein [Cohnella xylanilytica]|uniref:Helix-turn-helix domain-containing protein n=2 Tax=Cohnella xylanilytica TaxID=557555 RepID=A0A841U2Y1_9BACL|nr:helix-turn-helix domain-containing protein [Cohnella xylanilytica]
MQSPDPVQQAPQKPQRQTVDVKTAAELMGVSTGTIYTMVRENQLPHVKVRGRILFHRENIELWLRGELLAQYQA